MTIDVRRCQRGDNETKLENRRPQGRVTMALDSQSLFWLTYLMAAATTILMLTAPLLGCHWALLGQAELLSAPVRVRNDVTATRRRFRDDAER